MAAKKAAALESVDSDAPPPINTLALAVAAARKAALKPQRRDLQLLRDASNTLRRFQTSSVIDIEQALADACRSVDDTRAGTDEALDKADELQDSCAAVRDALLLNEEPPARLPAEDVSDALGMATRLSSTSACCGLAASSSSSHLIASCNNHTKACDGCNSGHSSSWR